MEPQDKKEPVSFSSRYEMFKQETESWKLRIQKQSQNLLASLRKQSHSSSVWFKERMSQTQEHLLEAKGFIGDLPGKLRAGKKGFNRDFWRSPYFSASVVALSVLVGLGTYLGYNQVACRAFYEGEEIGIVANKEKGELARASLEEELSEYIGQEVFLPGTLEYKTCMVPKKNMKPDIYYESALKDLPWFAEGVDLCIDGKPIIALACRDEGECLLESYQQAMLPQGEQEKVEKVDFKEDIDFRERQIAVEEISPLDEALRILLGEGPREEAYTVQDGDNLWEIARKNNLLVDDLCQANPKLSEDLKPGQVLKLASVEPILHVTVTSTISANEEIPFEVETKSDTNLLSGKTKVVKEGEKGEAKVVYRLVRENQKVVEKSEVEREIVKAPESKVVAKGTKRVYTVASRGSGGSGSLPWPTSGSISSRYGYRGSEFHTGLDIATRTGTAVTAVSGGRVTSTGWMGGYGNCILISHGNGMVTRYAHLSQINVRSGQSVSAGQLIGRVGATGRASGSHLHFEVIVNGATKNPLNYLR